MMETRSAVFKMLQSTAHKERCILKWPPPYSHKMTHYLEPDFHISVRKASSSVSSAPRMAKVIVLGDIAVGKTSLVNRFCHKSYNNNYKQTIGVDFEVERFDILGVPFNLQIWDTAGQERFKAIAASYYRGAHVIMVVFDLGSLLSLSHCRQWLNEARQCNNGEHHIFLVGTKKDLMSSQTYAVIERRAIVVAEAMKAEYWSVSAKMNNGVTELFTRVAALSFNAAMLRELSSMGIETTTALGSDLIKVNRSQQSKDKYQKRTIEKKINKWPFCNIVS